MISYFLAALPQFLAYFGSAVALAVVFLFVYSLCTPHREFALIREGNAAAATQLTGTFLGFAIPMAVVIGNSVSIPDMLLWGAVAALVQLGQVHRRLRCLRSVRRRHGHRHRPAPGRLHGSLIGREGNRIDEKATFPDHGDGGHARFAIRLFEP